MRDENNVIGEYGELDTVKFNTAVHYEVHNEGILHYFFYLKNFFLTL